MFSYPSPPKNLTEASLNKVCKNNYLETDPKIVRGMSREQRIQQAYAWAVERHSMYLRKSVLKTPGPYSRIPIMAETRWCNVFRELDKVSDYFLKNIFQPNQENPNLWFAVLFSRYVNLPETIQELHDENLLGLGKSFNWERAGSLMQAKKDAGGKFITGAYIVNSMPSPDIPKDIARSKAKMIAYRMNGVWEQRKSVSKNFHATMELSASTYHSFTGFGPFLSYQATVDLSYLPGWLSTASDYDTFNLPGPGTNRGMQRLHYGRDKSNFSLRPAEEVAAFLQEFLTYQKKYWPSSWPKISMSNASNILCEVDKWFRLVLQEGSTRSKYVASNQTSLF